MPSTTTSHSHQCQHRDKRGRCRRNQTRNGLCGLHQPEEDGELHPLADLLNHVLHGDEVPRETLEQLAANAVSSVVGRRVTIDELKKGMADGNFEVDFEAVRIRAADAYSQVRSRVSSSRLSPEEKAKREAERKAQQQANHAAREKAANISRARRILGYSAKEPVTRDAVKARHRELARKHHPDRGGDLKRMQDINWAVEILLGPG